MRSVAKSLVHAVVISPVNCNNSVCVGLPLKPIHRLQLAHNATATIVNPLEPRGHNAPCLLLPTAQSPLRTLTCLYCNNSISSYPNNILCTLYRKELLVQSEHTNFTICVTIEIFGDIYFRTWSIHIQIRNHV